MTVTKKKNMEEIATKEAVKIAHEQIEDSLGRKVHKSEPSGGGHGGTNMCSGAVTKDGHKYGPRTHPCHNPIHEFKNAAVFWGLYNWRTKKEIAKDYLTWLRDDSPWAKAGVFPTNDDFEFQLEKGFVFTDLDKTPANLFHNCLVGYRAAAEWPNYITAWHELVKDHGINPSFAFAFLTLFSALNGSGNDTCSFVEGAQSVPITKDKYDWPLDMARADETYLMNFVKGKAVGGSKFTFFPDAVTAPVNTVWGKLLDVGHKDTYLTQLLNRYDPKKYTIKRTCHLNSYIFDRSNTDKYDLVYTPESLLEIMKLEEKRLFIHG